MSKDTWKLETDKRVQREKILKVLTKKGGAVMHKELEALVPFTRKTLWARLTELESMKQIIKQRRGMSIRILLADSDMLDMDALNLANIKYTSNLFAGVVENYHKVKARNRALVLSTLWLWLTLDYYNASLLARFGSEKEKRLAGLSEASLRTIMRQSRNFLLEQLKDDPKLQSQVSLLLSEFSYEIRTQMYRFIPGKSK